MSFDFATHIRPASSPLAALAILLSILAPAPAPGQGTYAPVTAADVVAMRLMDAFDADGKRREPAFHWTFTDEGGFVLKKAAGSIPEHLLGTLLKPAPAGRPNAADEVRGKWALKGGQLVLTDIRVGGGAGDVAGADKVEMHIYRSAPDVIRIDHRQEGPDGKWTKVQYAFVLKR